MSSSKNLEFEKTSFLSKSNSAFIEQMYLKFINKDKDLPESWKNYFEGMSEDLSMIAKEINGPSWGIKQKIDIDELQKRIEQEDENLLNKAQQINVNQINSPRSNEDSIKAVSMIRSYRQRGHLIAKLDPLELLKSDYLDELHPESFGFKKEDYKKNFIILDVAMNDLMRPALYGAAHKTLPSTIVNKRSNKTYEFVGPICESTDKFATYKNFQKLEEKDLIVLCDVGAYGMTMASPYNRRALPAEVLIKSDNTFQEIRKRETAVQMIEELFEKTGFSF